MISFATEFPIAHRHRLPGFLDAVRTWILGSPHTPLQPDDFLGLGTRGEWNTQRGVDRLDVLSHSSATVDAAAVRYTKTDGDLEWVTTIVFSREADSSWVGIRVSCECTNPARRLPPAKKPVVVRTLLNDLGGGADAALDVLNVAHRLDNADVDLAARLLTGRTKCRLPVVYVSSGFDGGYTLDCDRLASDLAGMAHVVVEPNRPFSLRLKLDVGDENVYGGTIGVYWPDGAGRRSFFLGGAHDTPGDLAHAIIDEVRSALVNRRSLDRCTWSAVQTLVSRSALDALKAAGSQEVDKYCDEFDKELKAKDDLLRGAEKEIGRLQAEIRKYEARAPMGAGLVLRTGTESDLFESEIADIVRDAMEDAASRVTADSRRAHVLAAILAANAVGGAAGKMRERVKDLLRGMTTVDAKIRRGLEDLGFAIDDDGKHYKIVFKSDDRYTFTLPKSGSDHRGGLNAASDIGRLFL
ncbi:MAG: hypothetical protein IPK26_10995 [Planctomycetes bacterium]|nr:hypothetical protein [Planctomycetota bacterium]